MKRNGPFFIWLLLALLALNIAVQAREAKRDPESGKIRILYFGDAFAGPSPYPVFSNDPLTRVLPVRASGFHDSPSVIKRHMRMYMPRTAQRLFTGYDMIILSDANIQSFRGDYFAWFRDSVLEEGLGLVMIGGLETFGAHPNFPGSWGDTVVAPVLPVICLPEEWEDRDGVISNIDGENVFMSSLPFEEIGRHGVFHGCNIVGEREGVAPLAYYEVYKLGSGTVRHPLFCFWEVGEGASYAMMADWTPAGGKDFLRWGHYGDYALNLAIYVCGGNVPQDIVLVYRTRGLMEEYRSRRGTLEEIIEFVSKFGARMAPAERILGEAEEIRDDADSHYLDGEMERASVGLSQALAKLAEATERAYELRDEALLWVYVSEWLAVASTGLVCGYALWTLMIRKRAYRVVGHTRLIER